MVESVLHIVFELTIFTVNAGISQDSDLSSGCKIMTMSGVCLSFGAWHLCILQWLAQVGHIQEVLYI